MNRGRSRRQEQGIDLSGSCFRADSYSCSCRLLMLLVLYAGARKL